MSALHQRKILPESLYQSLITPGELNDGSPVHYAKGLVNFSNFGHQEIAHEEGLTASCLTLGISLMRICTLFV